VLAGCERSWRIYAELAQRLIAQARRLYTNENLGLDLSDTVYLCSGLDHHTKAAVKIHTLLDLRGSIPSFIHTTGTVAGQIREIN
jgi:hypothetical protein